MNVLTEYLAELVHAQLEGRAPQPIPAEINTDDLFNIARRNHMTYLLLGGLLKAPNLPESCKELYRKVVMGSILQTMAQVTELKELARRCEEKGIINQPMKGSRLKFIYPAPEMREMSDIDILIEQSCMEAADKELSEMGYKLEQAIKHHDIYKKAPYMVVEAHKAMYDKTVDNNQYEYFSNFSKTVLCEGCSYTYDFNQEDFYIYMIAHMAKHFYAMGCGIRNLVDIYVYLEKYGDSMNREYLNEEFKKLGLDAFVTQMEKLARVWLGGEPGDAFCQNLFDYMLDSGIYGKDENGIWHKFSEEKMKDKQVSRLRLKLWYYFPSMHYMAEYYPWLEDKPFLLPVAWGIRAYRGIFMKKGVHKKEMLKEIEQDKIMVYKEIYQKVGLHFK